VKGICYQILTHNKHDKDQRLRFYQKKEETYLTRGVEEQLLSIGKKVGGSGTSNPGYLKKKKGGKGLKQTPNGTKILGIAS